MAKSDQQVEGQDRARAKRAERKERKSERLDKLRSDTAGRQAGWGNADPRQVARLITAVTETGAAVMLAITSDGGALAITFYDNGDRERAYIPVTHDLTEELEYLIELWA